MPEDSPFLSLPAPISPKPLSLASWADIQVGDFITMPTGALSVTTAASYSQYRQQSAFTGRMLVTDVRMLGNSRTRDASGWVTVLEAVPV